MTNNYCTWITKYVALETNLSYVTTYSLDVKDGSLHFFHALILVRNMYVTFEYNIDTVIVFAH